ncbi:pyrroline-5-carboxylate reductase [Heterostelium album PN500]|uniref:pyrroline-5-carboxylate reductase n=1 Tax=Heterostelium pallidum (strain ATCC 26659 / Pp 5 / PN500) TaxID=670386 RepID=D3B4U0_HETP5|nr:pyrroline-5-carboxylate reductase [Heterostelium album PN500]EFA84338.1 pyrroline-5-carboxylate reductase [Heterostelium album PN500]|eukprot:XP_020436453.1 pyrroline-5-carboxylate reductase [Heterostelium album PN500]
MTTEQHSISVLGCGNIGLSIAHGLVNSGLYKSNQIILTKRNTESLEKSMGSKGFQVTADNNLAVKKSKVVIVCVTPAQLDSLLESIRSVINPKYHVVISVVSGASIDDISVKLGSSGVAIVRAMPNTAIQYCQSMTCLAVRGTHHVAGRAEIEERKDQALAISEKIFNVLGNCIVLKEEQIVPATALCACGIAFFFRAIRAASQGGIEIGFHAEDAIKIAAQTAKGAATLVLEGGYHPEYEIDKVTTPMGCTIAGLNQMEHNGFSSAMIKGIVTSAEKAASLYSKKQPAPSTTTHHHHAPQAHQQDSASTTTTSTTSTANNNTESKSNNKRRTRNQNKSTRNQQQQQTTESNNTQQEKPDSNNNDQSHEQQQEQAPEQHQPSTASSENNEQQPQQPQQQQQSHQNNNSRRGKSNNSRRSNTKKEQEDPNNPWKKQENNHQHPAPVYDVNSVDEALAKARSRNTHQQNGRGNRRGGSGDGGGGRRHNGNNSRGGGGEGGRRQPHQHQHQQQEAN